LLHNHHHHHHHHLSSGAGTIGQTVAAVPSGPSLTPWEREREREREKAQAAVGIRKGCVPENAVGSQIVECILNFWYFLMTSICRVKTRIPQRRVTIALSEAAEGNGKEVNSEKTKSMSRHQITVQTYRINIANRSCQKYRSYSRRKVHQWSKYLIPKRSLIYL
jgi:hypothetical protein